MTGYRMQDFNKIKSQVDKLWEQFWTGGIANPLTVIEQTSFLMFARLLDMQESLNERKSTRTGKPFKRIFADNQQHLRWKNFYHLDGEKMMKVVKGYFSEEEQKEVGVFPHLRELADHSRLGEYMKDAQLMIQKPSLLVSAVTAINALPITEGDTKGDLYEYLLSKLTTAGINGQFRTPRHIIRLMVDLLAPRPDERVCDPACGTAGFLVSVMQYLYENYTSPEGVIEHDDGTKTYTGDLLEPYLEHIQSDLIHGFDFDSTMLRIAAMNLMLHGLENPAIYYQDTLGNGFVEKRPAEAKDAFDVILANPPFKGSLDDEDVESSLLAKTKTKKTELLFLTLILRMLRTGGRAAVIVPDGVLFGASKAHVALRKMLVEENQLEAVIAMPSGVFKPYAGVSTAILIFSKGGETDSVFFYNMENDGLSLDDKRTEIEGSDLPDILKRWREKDPAIHTNREEKYFFVPKTDIVAQEYDLSVSRYMITPYKPPVYDDPKDILDRLITLEDSIQSDLKDLKGLLG